MKNLKYILISVLMVVSFWQFDFARFFTSIKHVHLLSFLPLLLIQIGSQLLINYQWCRIGKSMGKEHNFFKMLYINARGSIIEFITPGVKVGGEVTRAVLLKRELGYSSHDAAALVTLQKIISLFGFFVINLFAFASVSNKTAVFENAASRIAVYSVLALLIALPVAVFAFTSFFEGKISKLNPIHKWSRALQNFALTLLSNVKTLKNIKGELFKQVLLSLIIWGLYPVKLIELVGMFTHSFDWVFLTEITFLSYMIGMIPLLPGGLGSFEAAMTSMLMVTHFTYTDALTITLLFRFVTFWFVILMSLAYVGVWKMLVKSGKLMPKPGKQLTKSGKLLEESGGEKYAVHKHKVKKHP